MTAATGTHNDKDCIDMVLVAKGNRRSNNNLGWKHKRWWWWWMPKGDLFLSTQYREFKY